jgi:hypothetical protein
MQRLSILECPSSPVQQRVFTATTTSAGQPVTYSAASTDYFALMGVGIACYKQFYPNTPSTADLSGAFQLASRRRIVTILDGVSNTILLSEMSGRPWIYKANGQLNPAVPMPTYGFGAWGHNNAHNASCYTYDGLTAGGPCVLNCSNFRAVYSFHGQGAHAAFADGGVRWLPQSLSGATFYALVTQGMGEVITGADF